MELTIEQIEKINQVAPNEWQVNEQGVFTEPYGIPTYIKEPVIYMRWISGGWCGGSCWDTYAQPFENSKPKFEVLDLVLSELKLSISFLQYRDIENLIHSNSETENEYYGNSTDYEIEYVILSELINVLRKN